MKNYGYVECKSGFSVSIQAGGFNYCAPKGASGPYFSVELGFPSAYDSLIIEYAEDPDDPTNTVYGYVPSRVVWDLLSKHGGIISKGEIPPMISREVNDG